MPARSSHSSTMSSHIVGPDLAPSTSLPAPRLVSKSSAALHIVGGGHRHSSSSSTPHVPAPHQNRVEDLRHAHVRLDARPGFELSLSTWSGLLSRPRSSADLQYRTPRFARQLLEILNTLQVPSWTQSTITPEALVIRKVSGSLTNAVFFVSSSTSRTLLLRIYGPSSGELISRPRELHTLHVLSSTYHLGPRVYGTFDNGRVEQYFESVTLTAADIRLPKISSHIGARMAELHCVDIAAIELAPAGAGWQIGAEKNVNSWLPPARHVLALPSVRESVRADLDLTRFQATWDAYMKWLRDCELKEGASKRVFCHNDAQYGNLLKLHHLKEDTPEHHQIIVVDFEYASPNPAAFDIANHFHEWTANYHGPTPHILDPTRYPTPEERRNFYRAYLTHCQPPLPSTSPARFAALGDDARERELQLLEQHVRAWSPASHAMWAVWGIVQAREDAEASNPEPEFDYFGYARSRMAGFYREVGALMQLP
ncbi:kinase-like protein [Dentipellis sp. KUC8613]|nr:kinase-like protein [Dentipellis sp. KUC8613]